MKWVLLRIFAIANRRLDEGAPAHASHQLRCRLGDLADDLDRLADRIHAAAEASHPHRIGLVGFVDMHLEQGSRLERVQPARRRNQLDVSRPSLREAIKELEKRGLLITRHGGGTFVGDVIRSIFADEFVYFLHSNERAINDYIEFRRDIDILASGRAAERATKADKTLLTQI